MTTGGAVPVRPVSNPLGLAVMALLQERPMHPYEMAATLRERVKEQSIKLNYGSLYTVVAALQREGLIAARQTLREGARPERTVYELTEAGGRELRSWMRDLLSTPVKEYPHFEAALSLMPVLPPEEVAALLGDRVRRLQQETARLRAELQEVGKKGIERLFLIEAEYAVAMLEAERAWVVKLRRLIGRSPGFTRTWKGWHSRKPHGKAAMEAPEEREAMIVRTDSSGVARRGRAMGLRRTTSVTRRG